MKKTTKTLGLLMAVLMLGTLLTGCGKKQEATGYVVLEEDLGAEQYGIGFRKTDVALGLEVQAQLDAMIQDGTAAEISQKWFGEDILLKDADYLEESTAAAGDDSLQKVKDKGTLILGLDDSFPPMGFRDENDQVVGFDIDLATEVAKRMGFWDGKKPFRFWEAYGGGNYSGELKSFSIREFFILNKLAPSLHLSYDAEELPISVKPEKPVDVTDVMALLSETYEGTEYDMTKNLKVAVKKKDSNETDTIISPVANPWMTTDMVNMLNGLRPDAVKRYRLVAVPQCSYSTVIQLRDWLPDAVGGVVWMAYDNPGQSPRIPIFCGTKDLPACFKVCGQHRYREDAAVWAFRRANKLATVRWGATKDRMKASIAHFTEKGQTELPFVESRYKEILTQQGEEAAKEYLTGYTADFAGATMLRWREMGDSFWTQFERGF